ncbi:MAG: tetratricopeptide repeat protein, partial [Terriglobales bacterium]
AEFGSLYEKHSKDPVVKKDYIQLLIMRDRLDDARKLNDEILKAQPGDPAAAIYKAEIEISSGKPNDAVDTLQAVLKNDPDNAVAHYQLGMAFNQMGNPQRAEGEWHDAVRLRPEIIEAHSALAQAAIRRGDAPALAQEADQIIALQPAASDGYMLRGMADTAQKQFPSAEHYLNQAVERGPKNPVVYVQLGILRMAQNQLDEARKAYQQALDLDPNSTDALLGLANIDVLQKQPDKAVALIEEQVGKYPNNSGFHVMLGDALQTWKKDPAGAEAEFKRAADLNKNNVNAFEKLGIVQTLLGSRDAALQTYLEGSQNNPKEIKFYELAGAIYMDSRDWDRAKQMFQKALALQPDDALSSNNLAYVMLQQGGNVDMALAMAQTARRQLPNNPSSADTLGWALYQKHVYRSAIGLFQEAVKKEPENAVYLYHLGMAYAKNGQPSLAKQQLDRVARLKPNGSEVEDLRKALAEGKG